MPSKPKPRAVLSSKRIDQLARTPLKRRWILERGLMEKWPCGDWHWAWDSKAIALDFASGGTDVVLVSRTGREIF